MKKFFQSLVDNKTLRHRRKKECTIPAENQNWTKMGLMFSARKPRFWGKGGGLSNTEIKWIKSILIKAKKTGDYTFFSFKYC